MAIRYCVNFQKAIETILWLANEKPGIDIYHIGKTIFYAEKIHLNKYARPIIGDQYIKGPYGPFPSTIRDIIHQTQRYLDNEDVEKSRDALRIVKKTYRIPIPNREPNMNFFSQTDIECLKGALKMVGDMTFDELKNLSHEEESFLKAIENHQIDYEPLIDNDNPLRSEIIEELRETSRYACI